MEKKDYTLAEAARVAAASEDELRCAIKDGLLRATLHPNTGEYSVEAADLTDYLRRVRHTLPAAGPRKRRILILDDEIHYANILKIELERDPRLEARFATWGQDGVRMARDFDPDLILIDFLLPDLTGEQVLKAIQAPGGRRRPKIIVYSAHTREAVRQHPSLESRLQDLGMDAFLSKSAGMRALILKCYEILGLEATLRPR